MGSRVSLVKTQGVFNKRYCRECKDRMNLNNFPIVSFDCQHRANLCVVCLQNYIYAHIDEGGYGEMQCPHPKCKAKLSRVRMAQLPYPVDIVEQYCTSVTRPPPPPPNPPNA